MTRDRTQHCGRSSCGATVCSRPGFDPPLEQGGSADRPPGLFVLRPSIGPNEVLSSDVLKLLGLEPATRLAMVMATLSAVREAAKLKTFRPWTAEEESTHVQQVLYILVSLESLNRDERGSAIDECRKSLSLHVHSVYGEPRMQPLRPVTELYLYSSALEGLFTRGRVESAFVNKCYFRDLDKPDQESLAETLTEIGAAAGPKLVAENIWMHWKDGQQYNWPRTTDRYDVLQYTPGKELSKLLSASDAKVHEDLLVLIDKHWESYYKVRAQTSVTHYLALAGKGAWGKGGFVRQPGARSSRGRGRGGGASSMQGPPEGTEAKMFTTTQLDCPLQKALTQMEVPTSLVHTAAVHTTYQRTESLMRVLGETVPFMLIKLASQDFVTFLGVETNPSTEALLKALVHASAQGEGRKLQTTAVKLYQFIAQSVPYAKEDGKPMDEALVRKYMSEHALVRKYFTEHPLILVDALPATPQPPVASMTVPDLKNELRALHVSFTDVYEKPELRKRLERARADSRLTFVHVRDVRWSSAELEDKNLFGACHADRTHECCCCCLGVAAMAAPC
jgi:hypothetical protein